MSKNAILFIFGVILAVIGFVGIGATVYAVYTVDTTVYRLKEREEYLKREISSLQTQKREVLSQAEEIVDRVYSQSIYVAKWMNARRNGIVDGASSPVYLYENTTEGIIYAESYWPVGSSRNVTWELISKPLVKTDCVPVLWELKDENGDVVVISYAEYNVETGKYINSFNGTVYERIDWESSIEDNIPPEE